MAGSPIECYLAVFWDIENCSVPRGKSPLAVVQCIRDKFLNANVKEAEFLCVCDVTKEPQTLLSSLDDAQVTVVHSSSEQKNAADDKLKQRMRKFADSHKAPVTLVLISGDVDFAADLSYMRNHHNYRIILVHNRATVKQALSISAHEIFRFEDIVRNAPEREMLMAGGNQEEAEVHLVHLEGLPTHVDLSSVKHAVHIIVNRTKGTVLQCTKKIAIVKYGKSAQAARAAKRMNQQKIFGCKITSVYITNANSPFEGRRSNSVPDLSMPPQPMYQQSQSPRYNGISHNQCLPSQRTHQSLAGYVSPQPTFQQNQSSRYNGISHNQSLPSLRTHQSWAGYVPPQVTVSANRSSAMVTPPPALLNHSSTPNLNNNTPQSHHRHSPLVYHITPPSTMLLPPGSGPLSNRMYQTHTFDKSMVKRHLEAQFDEVTQTIPRNEAGVVLCVTYLERPHTCTKRDDWRSALETLFQHIVQVLHIEVQAQEDGSLMGLVTVSNEDDAQRAIHHCHHNKLATVSIYNRPIVKDPNHLREEVTSIMKETPRGLTLNELLNLYKERFGQAITIEDLKVMREVLEIREEGGAKTVHLLGLIQPCSVSSRREKQQQLDSPFCTLHCCRSDFTLMEESGMLPYVKIYLTTFAPQLHALMREHSGEMHLMSFTCCYEVKYPKLVRSSGGVPLEHLISSVNDISISVNTNDVKKIVYNGSVDGSLSSSTPSEASDTDSLCGKSQSPKHLSFAREVVDLLKRTPGCQMSFSKFIPSYHHHFGRQCKVAEFGFTKLLELFEAIPHVLQILGIKEQRVLYLTHRVQVRRFTTDLCQVLKAQRGKRCTLEEFPDLYREEIHADLNMASFGVCYIKDMLLDIPESTVLVEESGINTVMSIPQRALTPEQLESVKPFSYEVVSVLKNCPQCTIMLSKFIAAYHHHFGTQCRVADYGFKKLVDLVEAIPDIVNATELQGQRYISLTSAQLRVVFSERLLATLRSCPTGAIEVDRLAKAYEKMYGQRLSVGDFLVNSIYELTDTAPHIAKIEKRGGRDMIVLVEKPRTINLAAKWMELLMSKSNGSMKMKLFKENCGGSVTIADIKKCLSHAVQITGTADEDLTISLHPLLDVARRILILLNARNGDIQLSKFDEAYRRNFGVSFSSQCFGYKQMVMFKMLDSLVTIKEQTLCLCLGHIARLAGQIVDRVGIYPQLVQHVDCCEESSDSLNSSSIGDDLRNLNLEDSDDGEPVTFTV